MRIAYFCCHPDHLKLGALSVVSARRYMPGVEIVHLTDEVTDPLPGADTVLRFDVKGNFWRRSWSAAATLSGNVLFLGTDTIFRRSVAEVFAKPFCIALPHIAGPHRYDAGIVFSRFPGFFKLMTADPVSELSQEDFEVDPFLAQYHQHVEALNGGVLELPGKTYGYVPRSADDPGIEKAAIVHYRGPRKAWMLPGWDNATPGWNDGLR